MSLSAKFIEKARRELGEDSERREECLRQFREWIVCHRFIKRCRQDDNFLLQFLRIRKFNLANAFESFEKFFLFRKKYEKWCNVDDDALKKVWQLYDLGYAYPLMERDEEGKRIIFVQARKFDTKIFNSTDAIRLLGLIVLVLLEEEETQIAGISTISDFTGVGFSYFNIFSMRDVREFADCVKHASVGREKENYFVNLPAIAAFLFEIGRKALTEKLRQRLIIMKNMDHLRSQIDDNLLPKEHGGIIPEAEMMKAFKDFYKIQEDKVNELNDSHIDWELIDSKDTCSVM
ncbi:CLUMA_CG002595, isoform A [Clunio marinus]|uniref:CLUMA_CG002595, isoform A n=1 Tax=Clunio marinus TaxID=568069 RepID=A0A1J1HM30_9DIPT|nr:CLUMA_CG002595, isoform A [Clunio marinus]